MEDGRPFLIGGQWSRTTAAVPVHNPYTGETIAHVCQAGPAEAERLFKAAREVEPGDQGWLLEQLSRLYAAAITAEGFEKVVHNVYGLPAPFSPAFVARVREELEAT